ncbi:hypothetical protein HD554DRAFT_698328 [Boletus coccyginus]|nr:hypothetical protein HD554DRAFT_698328 [Boletus coccyginus]
MKASPVAPAANSEQHTPARINPLSLMVPPMQHVLQIAPPALQSNGRQAFITDPSPPQPRPPSQSQLRLPPPPESHLQPNQPQPHSQQQSVPQQIKKNFQSSIPLSLSVHSSETNSSPEPVENIRTDEDADAVFGRTKELFPIMASAENEIRHFMDFYQQVQLLEKQFTEQEGQNMVNAFLKVVGRARPVVRRVS